MLKQIMSAGLVLAATLATPAMAGVNGRQHHQQHRIGQGVRSGELTHREAYRLEHQQYRIARDEAGMRATGGHLTDRERARLNREQNRASANIYAQKHDGQVR